MNLLKKMFYKKNVKKCIKDCDVDLLVKVLSVGTMLDDISKSSEIRECSNIILQYTNSIEDLNDSERELLFEYCIEYYISLVREFKNNHTSFLKIKNEVFVDIVNKRKLDIVEFLKRVIEADNIILQEEIDFLNNIVELLKERT